MCFKELIIVIFFSLLSFFIFVYLVSIEYNYKIFCIKERWKNKWNLIYRFLIGKIRSIIFYLFISVFLSFSIILNMLHIKIYEAVLILITFVSTILVSNTKIEWIYKNLDKRFADLVNYIFLYRFLVMIFSVIWLVVEFYFYTIPTYIDIKNLNLNNSNCYLFNNLKFISVYSEYILWSIVIDIKEKLPLLVNLIIIIFILVKKISFVWGVILATLGGAYIWKRS